MVNSLNGVRSGGTLSSDDCVAALELVATLYGAADRPSCARAFVERIGDLIECDAAAFTLVAAVGGAGVRRTRFGHPPLVNHELSAVLPAGPVGVVALVLERRDDDFTDRDCLCLALIAPHARRAYVSLARGPAHDDFPLAPLTRREHEVLGLVAAGESNRTIAATLGISPRTAQKHLEHLFRKLGVETRTAAAAVWHRHDHAHLRH
jgi:DNA-binding CsgD family transcriptional regulator